MSDPLRFAGIYLLSAVSHKQLSGFDCGKISLNSWLEQKTRSNVKLPAAVEPIFTLFRWRGSRFLYALKLLH